MLLWVKTKVKLHSTLQLIYDLFAYMENRGKSNNMCANAAKNEGTKRKSCLKSSTPYLKCIRAKLSRDVLQALYGISRL